MSTNPLIAQFASEPALLEPAHVDRFEACLSAVLAHPNAAEMLGGDHANTTDDFWQADPGSWRAALRPYVVKDGILQIPVKGVLLHNFPYAYGSYATGYEYIWRAFQRGCADYAIGAIKGIALVIDSPGGMVAGCFDAVDKMHALKQETGVPVRAFAHESAYSAAFALFSLGDEGVVSRTGGVGSVGVVTMHIDASKLVDEIGYKITFIFAGKHKVDGNPYEALPNDVKARIQARIDELYEVFVSTVARNRPRLTAEAIRETEALTFTATQALSNGLADKIGALDDALAAFAADMSLDKGDDQMSNQDTSAANQAAVDTARNEGLAAGRTEGATAERTRINAILGCEAAADRPKAALSAALKTDMSVEQASAFLADLPAEKSEAAPAAASPANPNDSAFTRAMDGGKQPELGAGDADGSAEVSVSERIMSSAGYAKREAAPARH